MTADTPIRVGLDVRYLSHGLLGGIHTYLLRLVPALLASPAEMQFVLYADRKAPLEIEVPPDVTVRWLPWGGRLSSVGNDLRLARHMAADHIDVAHHPANYGFPSPGGCSVITLHDALNLRSLGVGLRGFGNARGLRTAAMVTYLTALTRASVRRATLLITPSDHARRDIAATAAWPMDRIVVVPHAVPTRPEPAADGADPLTPHGLQPGFILGDALKNPAAVITAWRRLEAALQARHPLVLFARRTDLLPIVQEARAQGEVLVIERPDDRTLDALYRRAKLFVFPSWIEGFGLPLLEAMAAGTPVIASDRGSIPEVVGDAAILVDAEDVASIAVSMTRLLQDEREWGEWRARGLARVASYTWEQAAALTLEAYRTAFARARRALEHTR